MTVRHSGLLCGPIYDLVCALVYQSISHRFDRMNAVDFHIQICVRSGARGSSVDSETTREKRMRSDHRLLPRIHVCVRSFDLVTPAHSV